jgi:hypothetical protein
MACDMQGFSILYIFRRRWLRLHQVHLFRVSFSAILINLTCIFNIQTFGCVIDFFSQKLMGFMCIMSGIYLCFDTISSDYVGICSFQRILAIERFYSDHMSQFRKNAQLIPPAFLYSCSTHHQSRGGSGSKEKAPL